MVIANNNNHADEDHRNMDNQNMFHNDNGNTIHVIPEEEEDEFTPEELKNMNAIKDKLCKEWMQCNESIGNFSSSSINEYYARNFIEMGYDSVEMIENDFVILAEHYMQLLKFMDPLHREIFINNILKEFHRRDDLKRQHEEWKVCYRNAKKTNLYHCWKRVPGAVCRKRQESTIFIWQAIHSITQSSFNLHYWIQMQCSLLIKMLTKCKT